jgi:hypothetical protein
MKSVCFPVNWQFKKTGFQEIAEILLQCGVDEFSNSW